jgi:hypothetical protein
VIIGPGQNGISMAYGLVASAIARSTNGGLSVVAGPIDSTNANLLIAVFGTYAASAGAVDSRGNTWNALTFRNSYGGTCQIFWCVPTSVGPGHTIGSVDAFKYPAGAFLAFSGAHPSPFEAESGADYSTSNSPGSLTPSVYGALVISGAGANGAYTPSATGGFTVLGSDYLGGNAMSLGAGYLIQGTAGPVNPAWTWGTGATEATAMAVFKPALPVAPDPDIRISPATAWYLAGSG